MLTGLSRFWFAETAAIVPNHLLPFDVPLPDDRRGRIMICRRTEVIPIEAVVRGYLAGSGWKEYQATGSVCGIRLPAGLRESDRLPEPIFTPATKAELGEHDENIDFEAMAAVGRARPGRTRPRRSRSRLYAYAAAVAERAGILLADTKFEFGIDAVDRRAAPDRRGPDARLVAVLGRRDLRARPAAGELRQAVRPRLARAPAVGQDGARTRAARRRRRRARAPATSRPTSGSPAPASSAISRRT